MKSNFVRVEYFFLPFSRCVYKLGFCLFVFILTFIQTVSVGSQLEGNLGTHLF